VDEAEELAMTAAMLFQEYVSHDSGSDDAYVATARMAECYRLCGDYLKAIDVELQCIKLQPSWPDAHVGIAQSYMGLGDWDRVEHWARSALELTSKPDTPLVRETLQQTYSPRVLMGMARESKGDLDGALKYYEKAYAEAQVETLELRIKDLQVKLKDSKHKEGWSEAAVDERKLLRGTKPEKSIAFVTAPLFETWHPLTGEGHGGAESMIIELAPRFAQAGWRVAVFGTPGEFRGVDMEGVEWWNTGEYLPTEHFTVVVGSRIPQLYDSPVSADLRLLWAHDVNFGESIASDAFGSRIDRIDGIIALTQWHANHLRRLYPDVRAKNIMVIPNGVDVARYTNWDITQKDPNKFIWSSSPDRGIEVVMDMWPDIKTLVPDAHLDVYYGWTMIDKIVGVQENTFLEQFKNNTMREVERLNNEVGGINWFDRVDKKTLADQQMKANMWLYPTHFLETFCITAIEAQLAGAIPLVSNKGALSETVAMPDCNIIGGTVLVALVYWFVYLRTEPAS
jgi:glycosyltransferase involved in cell wall biosynthesis